MSQLPTPILFALSSLLDKEKKGRSLSPGHYQLDEQIHLDLRASLTKGEPTLVVPTTSLPLIKILAYALQKTGVPRWHIRKHIEEAATAALTEGDKVSDYIQATEEAVQYVQESLSRLPRVPRAGRTQVNGEVHVNVIA